MLAHPATWKAGSNFKFCADGRIRHDILPWDLQSSVGAVEHGKGGLCLEIAGLI